MPYGVPKTGAPFFYAQREAAQSPVPSGRRARPGSVTGLTCVPSRTEASIPDERVCSSSFIRTHRKDGNERRISIAARLRAPARKQTRLLPVARHLSGRMRPAPPCMAGISLRHARAAQQLAAPKQKGRSLKGPGLRLSVIKKC